MDRSIMEQEITEYAERHSMTEQELRSFVANITGSHVWDQEGRMLSLLTSSEVELVHDVVESHNSFGRRAS